MIRIEKSVDKKEKMRVWTKRRRLTRIANRIVDCAPHASTVASGSSPKSWMIFSAVSDSLSFIVVNNIASAPSFFARSNRFCERSKAHRSVTIVNCKLQTFNFYVYLCMYVYKNPRSSVDRTIEKRHTHNNDFTGSHSFRYQ